MPGRARSSVSQPTTRSAHAAVRAGRPTRTVRIGPVTGGSWLIRSTLRTDTAVRWATTCSAIPAARRTWISCRVMASITPLPSRGGAHRPPTSRGAWAQSPG